MLGAQSSKAPPLGSFPVAPGGNTISGLSSGAFMTVQLHLAHSASFIGAAVIAGGPYRCVESLPDSAALAADAYVLNAEYICMAPLTPALAPDPARLADLARATAAAGLIDPIADFDRQRLYIFTGRADTVVHPAVVHATHAFYRALGAAEANIAFVHDMDAGHCLYTDDPEDWPLPVNRPPYINYGGAMQSHAILNHLYADARPPAKTPTGTLSRFDQTEFLDGGGALGMASLGPTGFIYAPEAVIRGARPARGVHLVLHGCKQGHGYVNFVNGRPDVDDQAPYGGRYITGTGYNAMADSYDLIVLYPQAAGYDLGALQNPDGCWDWWGYTDSGAARPDYYTRNAVQIRALHAMLERVCGGPPRGIM